ARLHGCPQSPAQRIRRAKRTRRGVLPPLQRGDPPFQGAQLRADVGVAGAAELPFHLDQGFRLRLELVAFLPMLPGLPGERGPAVLESSELRADLPLRLVDEIALLAEERGLLVQGVALLQETLELDLRLIEFRKGLFPDHRVPRARWNAAIDRCPINLSPCGWRRRCDRFPRGTTPRRDACGTARPVGGLRAPPSTSPRPSSRGAGRSRPSSAGAGRGHRRPHRIVPNPRLETGRGGVRAARAPNPRGAGGG